MSKNDDNLLAFLESYGFSLEELMEVSFELNSFRSIAGTTLKRYMNRIIETIEREERRAFLKGLLLGIAIRKAVDELGEPELTEEERRINYEIDRLTMK